jgi:hypothetical protein
MNYPAASSGGSDFSAKNLSFDREWFVQCGLLPFFFIGTVFNRPKGRVLNPTANKTSGFERKARIARNGMLTERASD